MALMRDRKKFEEHRQRKLEESEKSGQSSNFNNPNQVKFEAGKTYRFRLLFDESDKRINPKTGDHDPFVSKWTHGGKNSEGKWRSVTCLTTHKKNSYNDCPVCSHNSKLYKGWKEGGSERDGQLYNMYKRKFNGFALAYVISDPTTPENNGHVKYFRFSIRQNGWFEREIWGSINTYGKTDEDIAEMKANLDPVGFDAFDTENGYDLIVTVTKQGEFLNYDYKFARQTSDIGCDIEQLEAEITEVDFDRHVTSSTMEELENFKRTVMLDSEELDEIGSGVANTDMAQERVDLSNLEDVAEMKEEDVTPDVAVDMSSNEEDDVLSQDEISNLLDGI